MKIVNLLQDSDNWSRGEVEAWNSSEYGLILFEFGPLGIKRLGPWSETEIESLKNALKGKHLHNRLDWGLISLEIEGMERTGLQCMTQARTLQISIQKDEPLDDQWINEKLLKAEAFVCKLKENSVSFDSTDSFQESQLLFESSLAVNIDSRRTTTGVVLSELNSEEKEVLTSYEDSSTFEHSENDPSFLSQQATQLNYEIIDIEQDTEQITTQKGGRKKKIVESPSSDENEEVVDNLRKSDDEEDAIEIESIASSSSSSQGDENDKMTATELYAEIQVHLIQELLDECLILFKNCNENRSWFLEVENRHKTLEIDANRRLKELSENFGVRNPVIDSDFLNGWDNSDKAEIPVGMKPNRYRELLSFDENNSRQMIQTILQKASDLWTRLETVVVTKKKEEDNDNILTNENEIGYYSFDEEDSLEYSMASNEEEDDGGEAVEVSNESEKKRRGRKRRKYDDGNEEALEYRRRTRKIKEKPRKEDRVTKNDRLRLQRENSSRERILRNKLSSPKNDDNDGEAVETLTRNRDVKVGQQQQHRQRQPLGNRIKTKPQRSLRITSGVTMMKPGDQYIFPTHVDLHHRPPYQPKEIQLIQLSSPLRRRSQVVNSTSHPATSRFDGFEHSQDSSILNSMVQFAEEEDRRRLPRFLGEKYLEMNPRQELESSPPSVSTTLTKIHLDPISLVSEFVLKPSPSTFGMIDEQFDVQTCLDENFLHHLFQVAVPVIIDLIEQEKDMQMIDLYRNGVLRWCCKLQRKVYAQLLTFQAVHDLLVRIHKKQSNGFSFMWKVILHTSKCFGWVIWSFVNVILAVWKEHPQQCGSSLDLSTQSSLKRHMLTEVNEIDFNQLLVTTHLKSTNTTAPINHLFEWSEFCWEVLLGLCRHFPSEMESCSNIQWIVQTLLPSCPWFGKKEITTSIGADWVSAFSDIGFSPRKYVKLICRRLNHVLSIWKSHSSRFVSPLAALAMVNTCEKTTRNDSEFISLLKTEFTLTMNVGIKLRISNELMNVLNPNTSQKVSEYCHILSECCSILGGIDLTSGITALKDQIVKISNKIFTFCKNLSDFEHLGRIVHSILNVMKILHRFECDILDSCNCLLNILTRFCETSGNSELVKLILQSFLEFPVLNVDIIIQAGNIIFTSSMTKNSLSLCFQIIQQFRTNLILENCGNRLVPFFRTLIPNLIRRGLFEQEYLKDCLEAIELAGTVCAFLTLKDFLDVSLHFQSSDFWTLPPASLGTCPLKEFFLVPIYFYSSLYRTAGVFGINVNFSNPDNIFEAFWTGYLILNCQEDMEPIQSMKNFYFTHEMWGMILMENKGLKMKSIRSFENYLKLYHSVIEEENLNRIEKQLLKSFGLENDLELLTSLVSISVGFRFRKLAMYLFQIIICKEAIGFDRQPFWKAKAVSLVDMVISCLEKEQDVEKIQQPMNFQRVRYFFLEGNNPPISQVMYNKKIILNWIFQNEIPVYIKEKWLI